MSGTEAGARPAAVTTRLSGQQHCPLPGQAGWSSLLGTAWVPMTVSGASSGRCSVGFTLFGQSVH